MSSDPNANPAEDCPSDLPDAPPDAIVRSLAIINQRGLHARASAKFVQTVEKFDADVRVTRCGETVGGTSIMGLMMLAAGPGTSITVTASGAESAEVMAALETLVGGRFGEDD
jgi:phosphocarrier protein HPr